MLVTCSMLNKPKKLLQSWEAGEPALSCHTLILSLCATENNEWLVIDLPRTFIPLAKALHSITAARIRAQNHLVWRLWGKHRCLFQMANTFSLKYNFHWAARTPFLCEQPGSTPKRVIHTLVTLCLTEKWKVHANIFRVCTTLGAKIMMFYGDNPVVKIWLC